MRRRIEVVIDEVVMEGFSRRDAGRVCAEMSAHLERLFARSPAAAEARSVESLTAGSIPAREPVASAATGRALAESVHRAVTHTAWDRGGER